MSHHARAAALLALLTLIGCAERRDAPNAPTLPVEPAVPFVSSPPSPASQAERGRHERLARRLALALGETGFRARVFQALSRSRYREGKIHLQAYLAANGGSERRELARAAAEAESAVGADLDQSGAIEIYLPVPEQRLRWTGDAGVLVATAELDQDAPVGFDLAGQRLVLDPKTPPSTPVIALGRAEQPFNGGPLGLTCPDPSCSGGGGTGSTTTVPGLYMTYAQFYQTFESWFKGNPEFETHILGEGTTTNVLQSIQCAGEYAGGPYTYDQNDKSWSGSVLLFSQTQLDQYKAAHAGRNVRVFVVEDDDTACQIKTDSTRFVRVLQAADSAFQRLTAGRDTTIGVSKLWKKAISVINLFRAVASWINSNDELVGNAVEDVAAGAIAPNANWIVKGENNITNGAIRLVMK